MNNNHANHRVFGIVIKEIRTFAANKKTECGKRGGFSVSMIGK